MKHIRVAVMNNYNFTEKEERDLHDNWEDKGRLFVNSNSLVTIKGTYPSIITINPYFFFAEPQGDLSNVRAYRIKWIYTNNLDLNREQLKCVDYAVRNQVPILLTFMRFRSHNTFDSSVTENCRSGYVFDHNWFRPTMETRKGILESLHKYVKEIQPFSDALIYTCDMLGTGCDDCGNCVRLTGGDPKKDDVWSLNLSSSGDNGRCMFHCKDCFAKVCLQFSKTKTPRCDVLYKNRKQKGEFKHA